MITYNEVIKRIKIIFSEFGIELDEFCEEVKINSLGIVKINSLGTPVNILIPELELALMEEFDIDNIDSIYEDSTIEEVANEIMELYNRLHYNLNSDFEISEYNVMWLVFLAILSMVILAIIFFS